MARLFKINKSNETKTPSLETSRFAKSTSPENGRGKLLKGNGKKIAKLSRGQKKIMNQNMKAFIRYLIVAICSAIVTFLSSSCTAGLVIGKNQRQHQENNISTKVDSTYYVPTITIR